MKRAPWSSQPGSTALHSARTRAALSRVEVTKDFQDITTNNKALLLASSPRRHPLSGRVSQVTPSVDTPRGGFLQAGASRRRFCFHFLPSIRSVKESSPTSRSHTNIFLCEHLETNQKQKFIFNICNTSYFAKLGLWTSGIQPQLLFPSNVTFSCWISLPIL